MALLRWDPWGEVAALQRDVNQLLGRTSGRAEGVNASVPLIDAFRTDEGVVVRIDLPGMHPDSVDVAVHDGVLTIAGERPVDVAAKDEDWLRRERPAGKFERSFSLPEGTDPTAISASFDLGVLELTIPHPPERKPHRIEVQAQTGAQAEMVDVTS